MDWHVKLIVQKQFINYCENGEFDEIKYILNMNNINIHAYNELGFRTACIYGRIDVIKYLINFNRTEKFLEIIDIYKCNINSFLINYRDIRYYLLSCGWHSFYYKHIIIL